MHHVSVSVLLPSAEPDLVPRYTGSKLEESRWLQHTLLKEERRSRHPLHFTPTFPARRDVPAYMEFCYLGMIYFRYY